MEIQGWYVMKNLSKIVAVMLVSIMLLGCDKIGVRPEPFCHVKQPLNLGHPTPLTLDEIRGSIITSNGITIELSIEEYKKLINNNKRIEQYIDECNHIIDSTEAYYQAVEEK